MRTPGVFPYSDLPIIMLSGYGERDLVIEAERLGVNEFLIKPVSANALLGRIAAVIITPRPMVQVDGCYRPNSATEPRRAGRRLSLRVIGPTKFPLDHCPRGPHQRSRTPSDPIAMRRGFTPWADPGGQPLVRFVDIAKRFNDVVALDRVSLEIYRGEFFALLGPSGCGKTTLLRILAGFETADEGRVLLAGRDLAATPAYRRPVNMMFQSYALFPHLSVAGNIAFGLRQDGLGEIGDRRPRRGNARSGQARGLGARRPDQLSGGQRQRVALARSLAKRPEVLLLDEPMAALDRKLREETQFELMELQARLGTTFVIVTHDQEEAMTVAHRIAVMDRGRIVQVATPRGSLRTAASRAGWRGSSATSI